MFLLSSAGFSGLLLKRWSYLPHFAFSLLSARVSRRRVAAQAYVTAIRAPEARTLAFCDQCLGGTLCRAKVLASLKKSLVFGLRRSGLKS